MAKKPAKKDSGVSDATDLNYEDAIAQIESIIERIESGEVGLEESIGEYERGAGLIKRCRAILDKAEQRIVELDAASLEQDESESA